MKLRDYQSEFIDASLAALREHQRVMSVAATGSGKTIMASEIMRRTPAPCLFLADAQELIKQNADKHHRHTGEVAGVEMANSEAWPGDRVVIATTQSIARRLDKWPRDYFGLIIVDECHRNSLGAMAQRVLSHFNTARVLGVTATPFRSDRKQLGSFYERIACEITLPRLIKEGYLSRIVIKSVPLPVDLSAVRTVGGDYNEADLGDALAPHLVQAAQLVKDHAPDRRTVVFLPLRDISRRFVAACQSIGLSAVHVDGDDREGLARFAAGEFQVISNAALLTTGWDCPMVDCVLPLRPTKSLSLFQQIVGRGTRTHPGKSNLLLLDPLWLTDDHSLIKSARLIAKTPEQAKALADKFEEGGETDLLAADDDVTSEREQRLADELRARSRRKARSVDAMEFCLAVHAATDYEPECAWEKKPVSDAQRKLLERMGFDAASMPTRGQASRVLDIVFDRQRKGLATVKQLRMLKQMGHPSPETVTIRDASAWIGAKIPERMAA
jgi:superfamily II DNA or RNA helicase